jgi:hypothetical protein
MLLVFFGAGASFDCGPLDHPARPFLPLTADLISREHRTIARRYRGCMPVIDYLEHATRDGSLNLEQALDRFAEDDPLRHMLICGWRATDRHAVELLSDGGLRRDCRLATVAKADDNGQGELTKRFTTSAICSAETTSYSRRTRV